MRSEQVNTRALLNGSPGDANYTNPRKRLDEREKVIAYWPKDLIDKIRQGQLVAPPWRMLLDPTAWKDVPPVQVHVYVRGRLARGEWPQIDTLRRRFNRVSNHRGADENPAQPSLL